MSARMLLRGGCVLTLGAKTPNFAEADVLMGDGRIVEVGPGLRARDAEVIDVTDTIVMPGFVDAHRHAWATLFRNRGEGFDGLSASSLTARLEPEDVYASTLIGLLSCIEAGITTVVDWSGIHLDRRYTEAVLQAHSDSQLRTVLVYARPDQGGDPGGLTDLVSGGRVGGPLTGLAYGPPDPGFETSFDDWAEARAAGLRIHAHAGRRPGDRGTIAALGERGLLGADVTLIHCTRLDQGDLAAIAARGVAVVLAPSVEMAEGWGMPPIQTLIDLGVRPGLGVDAETIAPGDMFAQMRAAISIQHATHFDLKLAGKGGLPHLLTTRDVIRYATIDGARAVGLGQVSGSLETGKQADVVVLRTDRPNIAPVNDPIGAVVWGMDTSNIDAVFVAGRALMRDGALMADVARARALAGEVQLRVASSTGLPVVAKTGEAG